MVVVLGAVVVIVWKGTGMRMGDTMGTTRRRGRERAVQSRAGKKNHQLGELAGRIISVLGWVVLGWFPLNRPSALALSLDYVCIHVGSCWYLMTRWRDSMGWMYSSVCEQG